MDPSRELWQQCDPIKGAPRVFPTAEHLWEACCGYFQWVEDHPLSERKAFAYQGYISTEDLPKMRAMTIKGLCTYLSITWQTWNRYREREGFKEVCAIVDMIIDDQKFTGAAADLLNAGLITRDLGLADRTELSGPNGAPIELNDTQRAAKIAGIIALAQKRAAEDAKQTAKDLEDLL